MSTAPMYAAIQSPAGFRRTTEANSLKRIPPEAEVRSMVRER